jgi:hypothetical protein
MGLRLGLILLFKIFNLLLEDLGPLCALQLHGIQQKPHFDPLVHLLLNLLVLGLQLAQSIFGPLSLLDFSLD